MTGAVPGAVYPTDPYRGAVVAQSAPDLFVPPGFWGLYPEYSAKGQTSHINTAYPRPPTEDGPGYAALGGQKIGLVNANPVSPIGV
jgi:hypothetical protein